MTKPRRATERERAEVDRLIAELRRTCPDEPWPPEPASRHDREERAKGSSPETS